ncbi:C2H2 finger domain transcription factor crzA [Drechslerella dactyloides]|uniref:C2H2 finger domain transcription factor crzA n=1 Tax=Drechslerella dactyloides TaxID=74499 RepID=A0AAD6NI13_DREDA|nr:C2H2 finger domain transcription factor crzA [Drechslerella dactyloides]
MNTIHWAATPTVTYASRPLELLQLTRTEHVISLKLVPDANFRYRLSVSMPDFQFQDPEEQQRVGIGDLDKDAGPSAKAPATAKTSITDAPILVHEPVETTTAEENANTGGVLADAVDLICDIVDDVLDIPGVENLSNLEEIQVKLDLWANGVEVTNGRLERVIKESSGLKESIFMIWLAFFRYLTKDRLCTWKSSRLNSEYSASETTELYNTIVANHFRRIVALTEKINYSHQVTLDEVIVTVAADAPLHTGRQNLDAQIQNFIREFQVLQERLSKIAPFVMNILKDCEREEEAGFSYGDTELDGDSNIIHEERLKSVKDLKPQDWYRNSLREKFPAADDEISEIIARELWELYRNVKATLYQESVPIKAKVAIGHDSTYESMQSLAASMIRPAPRKLEIAWSDIASDLTTGSVQLKDRPQVPPPPEGVQLGQDQSFQCQFCLETLSDIDKQKLLSHFISCHGITSNTKQSIVQNLLNSSRSAELDPSLSFCRICQLKLPNRTSRIASHIARHLEDFALPILSQLDDRGCGSDESEISSSGPDSDSEDIHLTEGIINGANPELLPDSKGFVPGTLDKGKVLRANRPTHSSAMLTAALPVVDGHTETPRGEYLVDVGNSNNDLLSYQDQVEELMKFDFESFLSSAEPVPMNFNFESILRERNKISEEQTWAQAQGAADVKAQAKLAMREYTLDLADSKCPDISESDTKRVRKHPATFQCPLCDKCYTRAYNLRTHLRTHTGERPFVCTVCGKAFARQHDRKRHESLHSGKKSVVASSSPAEGAHNSATQDQEIVSSSAATTGTASAAVDPKNVVISFQEAVTRIEQRFPDMSEEQVLLNVLQPIGGMPLRELTHGVIDDLIERQQMSRFPQSYEQKYPAIGPRKNTDP